LNKCSISNKEAHTVKSNTFIDAKKNHKTSKSTEKTPFFDEKAGKKCTE